MAWKGLGIFGESLQERAFSTVIRLLSSLHMGGIPGKSKEKVWKTVGLLRRLVETEMVGKGLGYP